MNNLQQNIQDVTTVFEPPLSGVYQGKVTHSRLGEKRHCFTYAISLFGFDIDDIDKMSHVSRLFGQKWFNLIRFRQQDYLKNKLYSPQGEPFSLRQRIEKTVVQLGGDWDGGKVFMLSQCRCLGLYFSPINFYYCYNLDGNCKYMLAEVSNTPWNQRHYYLVPMQTEKTKSNRHITTKAFHVSPFMDLAMKYRWHLPEPQSEVHVAIDNINLQGKKVFAVNMTLHKKPENAFTLLKSWFSLPLGVIKVVSLIYWQALQLFAKRIPFIAYQKAESTQAKTENNLEP